MDLWEWALDHFVLLEGVGSDLCVFGTLGLERKFKLVFGLMNLWLSRGSAIAKIVGHNAARLSNFCDRVTMYVYEEMIEGKKLTEIINEQHENVKYLPGHKLPANVVCIGRAVGYIIYGQLGE